MAVTSLLYITHVRLWSSILQVYLFIEPDKTAEQNSCHIETVMFVLMNRLQNNVVR